MKTGSELLTSTQATVMVAVASAMRTGSELLTSAQATVIGAVAA